MTKFLSTLGGALAASVLCAALPASAAVVSFAGALGLVLEDDGTGDLAGVGPGTAFSGEIDDETFEGMITGGPGQIEFGCCIAAGGLEISDDVAVDAELADALNQLQSVVSYAPGDLVDTINLEGDTDSDAGRIEVGLSLVYGPDTYSGVDPSIYRPDESALLFSLFFILQEDLASDNDIYSAVGLVDDLSFIEISDPEPLPPEPLPPGPVPSPSPVPPAVIPLPAGGVLFLTALLGLGVARRFSLPRRQ